MGYGHDAVQLNRRGLLMAGAATLGIPLLGAGALAQDAFPSGTIELLVHAGAGGGTDLTTHAVIAGGRSKLGWQMSLVRKTGAGGAVTHEYARSRPRDGHTVIVLTSSHMVTIARGKSPIAATDLIGIGSGTVDPVYLVTSASGPFATAQDFLEAARKDPLTVGQVTIGGNDHITTFLLGRMAGTKPMQAVPVASGAEVAINLIGGNLHGGMASLNEVETQVRGGLVRPLINFSAERSPELPDVPTARELGYDLVRPTVRGFAVLSGTPDDRVATLRDGFQQIMATEEYLNYLKATGIPATSVTTGEVFQTNMLKAHDDAKVALTELGLL